MAQTKYTYSVEHDTANGRVNLVSLNTEIRASAIVTALAYSEVNADVLDIYMRDALSEGDAVLLTAVVAAHQGVAPAEPLPTVVIANAAGDTPETSDGLPQITTVPGIDPKYLCFCKGVSKQVSVADNKIEWTNSYSSVQLMGMTVQAKGFDTHDKLLFEVGYYHPVTEAWVQLSGYGLDVPLVVDPFVFHKESCRVSNPITQGLIFRVVHTFKNPESTATPDIGILYHLQRPYA